MKNYVLLRFVKLNLYFFSAYSLLTGLWYAFTNRFETEAGTAVKEIMLNAAIFSLLFTLLLLLWYRRTRLLVATTKISYPELQKRLSDMGYEQVKLSQKSNTEVYKPTPPKAAAMAGKLFVSKSPSFYIIEGPARLLKQLDPKA
ncbi:hypothetical protein FVR03_14025 [Pontibacter qinzhouensis]|uniref:Uncharacterized protein n=1 Tax=Pontibacter qinzhouensis TaxID=2603253 RepID=A0A5C8K5D0_9BACT|nr:hypothetical protein [Pontibacter qinzhouensis]TXK44293.1 hypothetical protein FVR03_14025 [Pontibacter qinzhouensis]